jgi:hypothetical protein
MTAARPAGLVILAVIASASIQASAQTPPPRSVRPEGFSGRGVYYFAGRVQSPLAGVGKRPANHSNRVALDDEHTQVIVDRSAARIVVRNSQRYPDEAVIADLLFLAQGRTKAGELVPAGVHVKLKKEDDKVDVDLHPHWTVREPLATAALEVFEVVLSDGKRDKVVVSHADMAKVAIDNKILYRLMGQLVEVKDHREGAAAPTLARGTALADLSIGAGGRSLNKMFLRAQLMSTDDTNKSLLGAPLPDLLARGAWELRLTAQSSLLSQSTLRRDLFLLGLDRLPVVAEGMKRGLKKGETLSFAFRAGQGTVSWGKASQPLPDALDVARAFLEFNFLGAVLGRQVARAVPATRAAR